MRLRLGLLLIFLGTLSDEAETAVLEASGPQDVLAAPDLNSASDELFSGE